MNAFIYRGDVYCGTCCGHIGQKLINKHGLQFAVAAQGDSERYPQGPFDNGGGEADTPQHCATCGLFLENPLTTDGLEYVREAVAHEKPQSQVTRLWAKFYGIE